MRRLLPVLALFSFALVLTQVSDQGGPTPASGGSTLTNLYLDLITPPAPGGGITPLAGNIIPPDGSGWHELYPSYCATHIQEGYIDNGDGVVSPCDIIRLGGIPYHVTWVGPTYFVTCSATPGGPPIRTAAFEPTDNYPPSTNPICQVWHEVWPNFCDQIHIDSFHDNGNGILDECDVVDVNTPTGPIFYHIDRIGCNIVIEPVPNTPSQKSTWSWLKGLFGIG